MRVISIGHDKWWVHGNNDQEPFRNVSRKIDFDVQTYKTYIITIYWIYFSWSVKHYFLLWIKEDIFEIYDDEISDEKPAVEIISGFPRGKNSFFFDQ